MLRPLRRTSSPAVIESVSDSTAEVDSSVLRSTVPVLAISVTAASVVERAALTIETSVAALTASLSCAVI